MALVVVHLTVLWVAALSGGPRGAVLRRSLGEFGLPLIPSILLSLRFSVGTTPQRVLTPEVAGAALVPGLGLLALALFGGYLALRGGGPGPGANGDARLSRVDRRTLVLQLVLMVVCLSLVGCYADGVYKDHALFLRAQGLGLAVLGAGIFALRLDSLRRAPLLVLPLALALLLLPSSRRRWVYVLIPWAPAVCYSRAILRVHAPFDIVSGAVVGMLLGVLTFLVLRRVLASV